MTQMFVVDNSVVMSWFFPDETNEYADGVLEWLKEGSAVVPSLWPLEVVNVLLVAERRGRMNQADSARFLTLLASLPIEIEQTQPRSSMAGLLALGRANQLSSYDAAYLELAMRLGLPLATLDQKLRDAAAAVAVRLPAVG